MKREVRLKIEFTEGYQQRYTEAVAKMYQKKYKRSGSIAEQMSHSNDSDISQNCVPSAVTN